MMPLTVATRVRLERVFVEATDRVEASALLENDCADNLPLVLGTAPELVERIRLAALKHSDGSMSTLRAAIALARTDWRDLLVTAGFSDDEHAPERWEP